MTRPDTYPRLALVSMPFGDYRRPSLQLGLLSSIASHAGYRADALHLNLELVGVLGVSLYSVLTEMRGPATGDWLFSIAAFGDRAPDPHDDYLERFPAEVAAVLRRSGLEADRLRELRHHVLPAWIEGLTTQVDWSTYDVVGFSSTFQQNAASFALAHALKERRPDLITLFGGANFEGQMGQEWVRTMSCIDYCIRGEADEALPEFLQALRCGTDPMAVAGVLRCVQGEVRATPTRAPFEDMDTLPIPDYDDYFERATEHQILVGEGRRELELPIEGARGCWWGQKHHCTFCGLNGSTIGFRAKSPDRFFEELSVLARRYHSLSFQAVDNIMSPSYLEGLFRRIATSAYDFRFFFEVKSNLRPEQLALLARGGMREIQPGIESLSTPILGLMRKGVTAIQNVNTLRWAQTHGLKVSWNVLWGFPGELPEHYEAQLRLFKAVCHLQPPVSGARIWMERFSPIFEDRARFLTVGPPAPEASYAFIYPREVDLSRAAYFFEYAFAQALPDEVYTPTEDWLLAWRLAWDSEQTRPTLFHRASPGQVCVDDERVFDAPETWIFEDTLADIYLLCCERPLSARGVRTALDLTWSEAEVRFALNQLARPRPTATGSRAQPDAATPRPPRDRGPRPRRATPRRAAEDASISTLDLGRPRSPRPRAPRSSPSPPWRSTGSHARSPPPRSEER